MLGILGISGLHSFSYCPCFPTLLILQILLNGIEIVIMCVNRIEHK